VGDSDAATAGARVGAATPAADGHNPDFILAALGRVAGSIAAEPSAAAPLDTPVVREEVPADSVISGGLPSPGADSWAAPTAAAAPAPTQAPATAAEVPAGTSSGPTARSSRLLPNWETTATIVAVLILVVILLAIFA
jgi:hypothetical protein